VRCIVLLTRTWAYRPTGNDIGAEGAQHIAAALATTPRSRHSRESSI
jgi:hypothetical protein